MAKKRFKSFGDYWCHAQNLSAEDRRVLMKSLSKEERQSLEKEYTEGKWEDWFLHNRPSNPRYASMACCFEVFSLPDTSSFTVTVERKKQKDGSILWAIYEGDRFVFSKSKKHFVYEGMPSGRSKKSLKDTRFPTLDDAMKIAIQIGEYYNAGVERWKKEDKKTWLQEYTDISKLKFTV